MKIWICRTTVARILRTITLISVIAFCLSSCVAKPNSPDQQLIQEAEENVDTQNYEMAHQKLLGAIQLNPKNVKAHVLLGDVYYFQSNLIMYRMQILNLILKYGKRLFWATGKELDLATPTEELLKRGMEHYQSALLLLSAGNRDDSVEESYIHYELGWGYLALDDIAAAHESFQNSKMGGVDRWDAKSALTYVAFLEKKTKQGVPLMKKSSGVENK